MCVCVLQYREAVFRLIIYSFFMCFFFSRKTQAPYSEKEENKDGGGKQKVFCYVLINCLHLSTVSFCIKRDYNIFWEKYRLLRRGGEIEKLNSTLQCNVRTFMNVFKDSSNKVEKKHRQHAVGIFRKKDGSTEAIGPYYPDFNGTHSEDYVIEKIKKMEASDYSEMWIYTRNNPCIGRCGQPCMYNLITLANSLSKEYGIKMYIGFTRFFMFTKNMADYFENSKELELFWKQAIKDYNLDAQFKLPVNFDHLSICKKKIDKRKRKLADEGEEDIFSKWPDLEQTNEEWILTATETAERLVSCLREVAREGTEDSYFKKIKGTFNMFWQGKLNEKLTECLIKPVVLSYLHHFQGLEHYPEFFQVDPYDG